MNQMWETLSTIFMAVVGIAIVALLVSPKAQTTGISNSIFSGLSSWFAVAEGPVTGYTPGGAGGMGGYSA